ncbi:MAG: hypothetical protein ABIH92_04710 [Nanoarchaeota archaeon]
MTSETFYGRIGSITLDITTAEAMLGRDTDERPAAVAILNRNMADLREMREALEQDASPTRYDLIDAQLVRAERLCEGAYGVPV